MFLDEAGGSIDFEPADAGAGEDIAVGPDGDGDLGEAMPAGGVIEADIADEAGGAGGDADEAEFGGLAGGDGAGAFEAGADGVGVPEPLGGGADLGARLSESVEEGLGAWGIEVVAAAAGLDERASEAVAAEEGGEVEEVAADLAAQGGGGEEGHVMGEGAEVAGVVGEAFEFEGEGAEPLGAEGRFGLGEGFEESGVGGGVGNGGIAGGGFDLGEGGAVRAAGEGVFDPAVLVAEGDFEVEHVFALALEAEMAWLDDAGVDGADGDLMDFGALDLEEGVGRGVGAVRGADGFEPGVVDGGEVVLLPDLAFEEVGLGVEAGERGVGAGEGVAAGGEEGVIGIKGEEGDEPGAVRFRDTEPSDEAGAVVEGGGDIGDEEGGGRGREVVPGEAGGVGQGVERGGHEDLGFRI